jgi:hypothetical protein
MQQFWWISREMETMLIVGSSEGKTDSRKEAAMSIKG